MIDFPWSGSAVPGASEGDRPVAKTFNYSSATSARICESLIADIAAEAGVRKSRVIEECLVTGLLPTGDLARSIVSRMALGRDAGAARFGTFEAVQAALEEAPGRGREFGERLVAVARLAHELLSEDRCLLDWGRAEGGTTRSDHEVLEASWEQFASETEHLAGAPSALADAIARRDAIRTSLLTGLTLDAWDGSLSPGLVLAILRCSMPWSETAGRRRRVARTLDEALGAAVPSTPAQMEGDGRK